RGGARVREPGPRVPEEGRGGGGGGGALPQDPGAGGVQVVGTRPGGVGGARAHRAGGRGPAERARAPAEREAGGIDAVDEVPADDDRTVGGYRHRLDVQPELRGCGQDLEARGDRRSRARGDEQGSRDQEHTATTST